MKPNLFWYAPSELSQDAVLSWLLLWADNKHAQEDSVLYGLGKLFLDSIYEKAGTKPPRIYESIELSKQDGGIDIFCVVNGETALIIEDKVGTKEHSGQLPRYREHVIKKGYPSDKILSVYLQTGDQSDFSEVVKHGYMVYHREDLLRVLESSTGRTAQASDIVQSYTAYLRQIEDEVKSFKTLAPKEWSWHSWKGFYGELQQALQDGNWDYVANPSGGFLGFWWHFLGDDQCEQYLQLEEEKFCFKIYVKDADKRKEMRDLWHSRTMQACAKAGLRAKRPDRFGNGTYMTVAILDQEYRIVDSEGRVDLKNTVGMLRSAEEVLDMMAARGDAGHS